MRRVGISRGGRDGSAPPGGASGRTRRGGFTLVELLVVIAVLAILVALLMPTFSGLGKKTQTAVCASRLRVLQVAMTQYMTTYGFQLPGTDFRFANWVGDDFWEIWWGDQGRENIRRGQIWPYVQGFEAYLCPTFERICRSPPAGAEARPGVPYAKGYTDWGGPVPAFDPATFQPVRSYSLNEHIGLWTTRIYQIDPGTRVWLADENPWRQLYQYPQWLPDYGINNAHLGYNDSPGEYHEGKANCSFGDGHVERRTPLEIRTSMR